LTIIYKYSNYQTYILVWLTCIFIGGLIGTFTNAINGIISPYYFQVVMNWNFQNIWLASISQGILEGLIYGFIFSILFTPTLIVVTNGQSTFNFAFKLLLKILSIVLSCWFIGGMIAIFLSILSPELYTKLIPIAPKDNQELIKFAWVGGSIWGGMIGGLFSIFWGFLILKHSWNRQIQIMK